MYYNWMAGKDCTVNDVVTACSIYTLISCNKLSGAGWRVKYKIAN